MLDNYLSHGNSQIEIRFMAGDEQYARMALDALAQALPDLCAFFEVAGPFPRVRVVLVPDRDEFDRLVRDLLRVEIEVPSHPARIAQPQRTDMVVISPPAYPKHTLYTYQPQDFCRLLVHELVHMLEEFLTPDIETTPRWWSEGLAVFLSGQCREEIEFYRAAQEGIANRSIPTFQQIDAERRLAYDWGWTIVQFFESAYGRERIVCIVRECTAGDVFAVIGEDPASLEEQWKDWLLAISPKEIQK